MLHSTPREGHIRISFRFKRPLCKALCKSGIYAHEALAQCRRGATNDEERPTFFKKSWRM